MPVTRSWRWRAPRSSPGNGRPSSTGTSAPAPRSPPRWSFGKGLADEFGKRLNERGVREVMDEPISQGENDFGALITRMRDAGIRLVYFGGYHTEAGLFVRQARHLGLDATMMVNSAMLTREYWDLAGPAAEGTLMTFGPDPRKLPSTAEVVTRFEAEGHEAEARTLYSYAAVQVFADAARKAGSTDLDQLERELHADTSQTVLGPMTFDAKGDNVRYEFRMYRWHDGKYEEICCRRSGGQ